MHCFTALNFKQKSCRKYSALRISIECPSLASEDGNDLGQTSILSTFIQNNLYSIPRPKF